VRLVLDTNTCIYALKLQGRVLECLRDHPHVSEFGRVPSLKTEDWL
jgi:hypothetical protein